jgi:hypothetical protein
MGSFFGLISHFPYDAGHLDEVTYRSSESDAKRNPATLVLMFMQTVPEYPPPPESHAEPNAPSLKQSLDSRRGADLDQSLALLEPPLLLQPHDLEAVKVGERLAALLLELLLSPVALLPLSVDTGSLPRLLDGTRPGAAGELLDNDRGEQGVGERDDATGGGEAGVRGGAVNESLEYQRFSLFPNSHVHRLPYRSRWWFGFNIRACGR